VTGARYEIAIDGTPRTRRAPKDYAREAATLLKTKQPHAENAVHNLASGAMTAIEHNAIKGL
jgi:hypothetical protein